MEKEISNGKKKMSITKKRKEENVNSGMVMVVVVLVVWSIYSNLAKKLHERTTV